LLDENFGNLQDLNFKLDSENSKPTMFGTNMTNSMQISAEQLKDKQRRIDEEKKKKEEEE